MQIGNVKFRKQPLILAPMEDVTHQSFRLLCKGFGADWVYSEFIASDALIRNIKRTFQKIIFSNKEKPFSIQLYGKDINSLQKAAQMAEATNPDFIDINFGCPVKRVVGKGAGAGLLRNIPHMINITKGVVSTVNVPVTVKTRLSWDENTETITTIAEKLQDVGIRALTIHGRTRKQMFKGQADWTLIGAVKNNPRINIPIIGNGDIDSPEKAKYVFDTYGVDGLMIGRGSIGRPWIFKEIRYFLKHNEPMPPVGISEQISIIQKYIIETTKYLGEIRGILQSRKHLAKMFKGLPNFRQTRTQMLEARNLPDLLKILNDIRLQYSKFYT